MHQQLSHHAQETQSIKDRASVESYFQRLLAPVAAALKEEQGRLDVPVSLAHYSPRGADMEAVTRPLWGIVPWLVGGGGATRDQVPAARWVRAIAHGVNPESPAYWGTPGPCDQRWVEACIIGVALAWQPDVFWESLTQTQQDRLARWLSGINAQPLPDNNWLYFRVMVNLGLRRVGRDHDAAVMREDLACIDSYYLGAGWYRDGRNNQRDYYVPTGMHFYGLLYALLADEADPQRAEKFRERAAAFVDDYTAWFGNDGASLPFGRSLTYRFVTACFWPMLALARVPGTDLGHARGMYLRTLDWWSRRPILTEGGRLSLGFGYPNANVAEGYNAHGSPYWAFKAFIGLALPDDHAFWTAPAKDLVPDHPPRAQPHARMTLFRVRGEARALCAGQWAGFGLRHAPAKYAKFAYSSALGFSVPHGPDDLNEVAPDSMLALSEDGRGWRVRGQTFDHELRDVWCASTWRPWDDVTIRTWLAVVEGWQVRVHRIVSARALHTAAGGWAVPRLDEDGALHEQRAGLAFARGVGWTSQLIDLLSTREGRVIYPSPNTHLLHRRTALPLLLSKLEPGESWLACAARADRIDPAASPQPHPEPPRLERVDGHLWVTRGHQRVEIPIQVEATST